MGEIMEIINYADIYEEDVKNLLGQLQEYIVSIDKEKYNVVTENFKEEYYRKTMDEISKYEGVIFLAKEKESIVGLVVGLINNDNIDTYDFKAPKRGRVTELIVSKENRNGGIGNLLLNRIEEYFRSVGCKGILLSVFAYNQNAYDFYVKNGYFNRSIEMMKVIE